MIRRLILLAACAATLPAAAQTIWRCGPDGRSYSATPCAEGRVLALAGSPTGAALAEAQWVVQREQQALQTLAGERRAREDEARALWWEPAVIRHVPTAPAKPHHATRKLRVHAD
jgi:hypothetical protein